MSKLEKIAVIGEGKMGSSIFLYLNGFKFKLFWLCSSEAESDKARKTWYKKTKLQFQSGIISEEEFIIKSETTIVTNLVTDLKDCDLII
jgi:3-hydroxyacyl-CoA dehydrogenase